MPPKPKYTEQEIAACAFEIAREEGLDAIAARSVAKRLGTTTSPIFTCFSGMDALKAEVLDATKRFFIGYLEECLLYEPAFKAFGLRFVRFAKEEPNLYRMLISDGVFLTDPETFIRGLWELFGPMCAEIEKTFGLSEMEAEKLLIHMLTYANGLAPFLQNGKMPLDEAVIGPMLSEECLALVMLLKTRNGSMNEQMAEAFASAGDTRPVKRPQ